MSKKENNEIRTGMSEEEVFGQKISDEELSSVAGGEECFNPHVEYDSNHCTEIQYRNIHELGCQSTVEDGSDCWSGDACWDTKIIYTGMENCFITDCNKARN